MAVFRHVSFRALAGQGDELCAVALLPLSVLQVSRYASFQIDAGTALKYINASVADPAPCSARRNRGRCKPTRGNGCRPGL